MYPSTRECLNILQDICVMIYFAAVENRFTSLHIFDLENAIMGCYVIKGSCTISHPVSYVFGAGGVDDERM